jgi:hypothetical protein
MPGERVKQKAQRSQVRTPACPELLGAFLHEQTADMPYALMWSSTVIFIGYPMSSAMEVLWLDVPPLFAPDLDEPGATQRRTATVALFVGVRGPVRHGFWVVRLTCANSMAESILS